MAHGPSDRTQARLALHGIPNSPARLSERGATEQQLLRLIENLKKENATLRFLLYLDKNEKVQGAEENKSLNDTIKSLKTRLHQSTQLCDTLKEELEKQKDRTKEADSKKKELLKSSQDVILENEQMKKELTSRDDLLSEAYDKITGYESKLKLSKLPPEDRFLAIIDELQQVIQKEQEEKSILQKLVQDYDSTMKSVSVKLESLESTLNKFMNLHVNKS